MSDRTGVNQYDRALRGVKIFHDNIHHIVLSLGIVLRVTEVDWLVQALTLDLLLDHVGWQRDVGRSTSDPAFPQSVIDQGRRLMRIVELRDNTG